MNKPGILKNLNSRNIWLAVVLGLSVSAYFIARDFDIEVYNSLHWSAQMGICLALSLFTMFFRDLFYIIRLKWLSDHELSWKASFNVVMMWEFASAVTPTVLAGTTAAVFFMMGEKVKAGRATAIVIITAFLDEIFFITSVPIIFLIADDVLPNNNPALYGTAFWICYTILALYTIFLVVALLVKPKILRAVVRGLASISFLKRFKRSFAKFAHDMEVASAYFRAKSWTFWLIAYASTVAAWTARYVMVNFLLAAFIFTISFSDHLLIYGKLIVMWIFMNIAPTPGASGIAEIIFPDFFKAFMIPNTEGSISFLWRALSHYPYIAIGAIILPLWLKRIFATTDVEKLEKEAKEA